MFKSPVAPAN